MSLEITSFKEAPLEMIDGDRGKNYPKQDEFTEDGFCLFLNAKNVTDHGFNFETKMFISQEKDEILKKGKLQRGDVILTTRGTVGNVAFYSENIPFDNIRINSGMLILRSKSELSNKFLYYVLKSDFFKKQIYTFKSGTAQPQLPISSLNHMKFYLPKINIQKKIVTILSNIDKKIKVLEEINKNLEKTLITIFNSWFINFENYDNSKGMKIDESYGEIPVDWSVEMLEDYVDFVTGVEPGSKNYHEKPEPHDIPFLRVGDLGSRDNGVFIDPSLSKNKILKYDDIVLSLDATIGIVKMGLEGAYSTGMRKLVIKNDNINQPFLYCLVKSNRIQRIIETFATGTTILHAGKSIKHMNFVLSDKKTMDDFGKIGNPIISIILTNLKEIEYLTNLRDTLLPKLMSGEIDVSKINCDLKIIIRKIYIKSSKLFLWRYLSENQNYIKNTKSNETLLKSRTIYQINKFLAKFNARYRYYRQ